MTSQGQQGDQDTAKDPVQEGFRGEFVEEMRPLIRGARLQLVPGHFGTLVMASRRGPGHDLPFPWPRERRRTSALLARTLVSYVYPPSYASLVAE